MHKVYVFASSVKSEAVLFGILIGMQLFVFSCGPVIHVIEKKQKSEFLKIICTICTLNLIPIAVESKF
jgi:uncharacterized SAM-binding protein YcdF (DUF218 family)